MTPTRQRLVFLIAFAAILGLGGALRAGWSGSHAGDALVRAVAVAVDLGGAAAIVMVALALDARWFSLLGGLAWALQPWTPVIAIRSVDDDLVAILGCFGLAAIAWGIKTSRARDFAIAGSLGGVCQLVRTDAIFLLAPIGLAAVFAAGTRNRRLRLGAIAIGTWMLMLAPRVFRNRVFGDTPLDRGAAGIFDSRSPTNTMNRAAASRWLRTWCIGTEDESVRVTSRFPSQRITIAEVPDYAFDSRDERDAVRRILDEYDREGARLTTDLATRLDAITDAHRARHPVDFWLRLPFLRMSQRLFPPRDGYGMGTLPTLQSSRAIWCVLDGGMVLAGILSLLLLSLARRRIALVLASFLVCRVALMAALPVPEPRDFLPALPLLYAAAAALPIALRLFRQRLRDDAQARAAAR